MRIAENAAVLVFLIYLKHIDNHGFCIRFRYSSTLFIQWIKRDVSNRYDTVVTPPLNMSVCFCGAISDSGMAKYTFGFDQNTMTIHSPNERSVIANLIMIGKI